MNITITGNLGSGKSSVCKELEKAGLTIVSSGTIFRQVAEERGVSVTEMNELAKKDRSIDDEIDERSTRLGKELTNTVFDSRMGWNFVPDSLKVFLFVDMDVAAERVFADSSRNAEKYESVQECREKLIERSNIERERYGRLYGKDYYDYSNYDLVIETTNAAPAQTAKIILDAFENFEKGAEEKHIYFNTRSIYPAEGQEIPAASDAMSDESLIAKASPSLCYKDGFCQLADGVNEFMNALKQGKVFVEPKSVSKESSSEFAAIEQLRQVEEAMGIKYDRYPSKDHFGYMNPYTNV